MAILESTFLIDILQGKPEVESLMKELERTEDTLCIAAPSLMEIWYGALKSKRKQEKADVMELFRGMEILPFDNRCALTSGEIQFELEEKGQMIQPEDIMIAGIARVHAEKIVTRDAGYTRISGLRVLKY